MSVQQDVLDLGAPFIFCDLSTFTQNIPIEWVASALDLSSQDTIRRRRLPCHSRGQAVSGTLGDRIGFMEIKSSMQRNAKKSTWSIRRYGASAGLQRDSPGSQSGGGGVWPSTVGHPFQTGLPVHRRAIDRDGSGQSDFSHRKTLGRIKGRYRRIVSGSPPKAFETKDGEDFKDPFSSGP